MARRSLGPGVFRRCPASATASGREPPFEIRGPWRARRNGRSDCLHRSRPPSRQRPRRSAITSGTTNEETSRAIGKAPVPIQHGSREGRGPTTVDESCPATHFHSPPTPSGRPDRHVPASNEHLPTKTSSVGRQKPALTRWTGIATARPVLHRLPCPYEPSSYPQRRHTPILNQDVLGSGAPPSTSRGRLGSYTAGCLGGSWTNRSAILGTSIFSTVPGCIQTRYPRDLELVADTPRTKPLGIRGRDF